MATNLKKNILSNFTKDLGNEEIYPFRGAFSPLLTWFPWQSIKRATRFPILAMGKERDAYVVTSDPLYRGAAREGFQAYMTGEKSIADHKASFSEISENIKRLYEEVLSIDLSVAPEIFLTDSVYKAWYMFTELLDRTLFIETFDKEIMESVLGYRFDQGVWEKATHPAFMSFDLRRLIDVLELSQKYSEEELITRCMYVYTDYYMLKSEKEVLDKITHILKDKKVLSEEIEMKKQGFKNHINEYGNWVRSINKDDQKIIDYIQFVMEERDLRKDPVAQGQVILGVVGRELAKRAGLSERTVPLVYGSEYAKGVDWLKNHKENLEARKDGMITRVYENGEYATELGDFNENLKAFEELLASVHGITTEVKGTVASRGKVTGRVRIILDATHYKEFQQGDILVTSMTRPEFVPLMKMAGAVVTNEGGVTCHAAIVSRELNIPCIIGTKVATQILKDGDMVEVDAEKGIIKKIL